MKKDDFFKSFGDELHQHIPSPPEGLWNQIDQSLDQQEFDELVTTRMDQITTDPPQEVWQKLEPSLPRHLFIRRYLRLASSIAAILVLGFGLQLLLNTYCQSSVLNDLVDNNTKECEINPSEDLNPPHLAAEPTLTKERKIQRRVRREKISLEDALLEELLMEEEDIVIAIDSALIRESLKPAKQPNASSAVASADEEIELQISIPLKIVEDNEVEELLHIYEQRNK